jgi:hypothetical protein
MSIYIPHYKHDIFVSYAQVDNEPLAGADKGWVTTLITGLKSLLRQQLGGADAYSLWMDYQLPGHKPVTLTINEQLKSSATFLLILSPGYFASSCRSELDIFLRQVGSDSGRIFVVEKGFIEREQKPPELQKLSGYPFWVKNQDTDKIRTLGVPKPNPEREPEYYQKLDDLARELAKELGNLKEQIESAPLVTLVSPPQTPKETIFLAEVTDDLTRSRDQVKRYLEQQGLQVLPSTPYYFHTEAELHEALAADLRKSSLFVQLLSDSMPQRPVWMTTPMLQWERAKQIQELTILQWRDSKLELETVSDATYRALLEGSITGMTLEEFQQYVIQRLEEKKRIKEEAKKRQVEYPGNISGYNSVFIRAYHEDEELAKQIDKLLNQKYEMLCVRFIGELNSQAELRDLKGHFSESDAVLIIYGKSPLSWIYSQLRLFFKLAGRRQPRPCVALCEAPPVPKEPLEVSMPFEIPILNCSHQPLEDNLRPLISCLETHL